MCYKQILIGILSHPLTDTTQKEDIIIMYVTVLTYEIGLHNIQILVVKIGILVYNTLQVVPTILCYVYSYNDYMSYYDIYFILVNI